MAHVIEVTEQGMSGQCDRCGAQAYVEVVLPSDSTLKFCGHHASENMDALKEINGAVIADHRPFLKKQEPGLEAPVS